MLDDMVRQAASNAPPPSGSGRGYHPLGPHAAPWRRALGVCCGAEDDSAAGRVVGWLRWLGGFLAGVLILLGIARAIVYLLDHAP